LGPLTSKGSSLMVAAIVGGAFHHRGGKLFIAGLLYLPALRARR
jgi:hypothetical protein